jgi:hypothetical protein
MLQPVHVITIVSKTAIRQRDMLGGAFDEMDWTVEVLSIGLSPPQQPGRRIESEDFLRVAGAAEGRIPAIYAVVKGIAIRTPGLAPVLGHSRRATSEAPPNL